MSGKACSPFLLRRKIAWSRELGAGSLEPGACHIEIETSDGQTIRRQTVAVSLRDDCLFALRAFNKCGGAAHNKCAGGAFMSSILQEKSVRWTVFSGAKRRMMDDSM